ncbi:MAG: hypothetical protein HYV26_17700 [Candidatus Hydrogenedentes bacterium]|nr:hypothetical protein [Candidatus Hydrogenedentota bacterium]
MEDDPVIARIQEVRHQISAACDHDPDKLVDYYLELQARDHDRPFGAVEGQAQASGETPGAFTSLRQ